MNAAAIGTAAALGIAAWSLTEPTEPPPATLEAPTDDGTAISRDDRSARSVDEACAPRRRAPTEAETRRASRPPAPAPAPATTPAIGIEIHHLKPPDRRWFGTIRTATVRAPEHAPGPGTVATWSDHVLERGTARVVSRPGTTQCEAGVRDHVTYRALRWHGARPPSTTGRVEIVAAESWTVVVVDAAGVALADADLRIEPRWSFPPRADATGFVSVAPTPTTTSTDRVGRATTGLGRGLDYRVVVSHPDHVTRVVDVRRDARPDRIVLARACSADVLVVDDRDRPVLGASIASIDPAAIRSRSSRGPEPIRIHGIDPRRGRALRVTHADFVARAFRVDCRSDGRPARIRMQRGHALSGWLVDRDGEPCGAHHVRAVPTGDATGAPWRAPGVGRTDPDGRFEFRGLAAGRYRLLAAAGTDEPVFTGTVEAGWQDYVAVLDPAATSASLTVVVRPAHGDPRVAADAQVTLEQVGTHVSRGESRTVRGDGTVHWTGLPPGTYRLDVSTPRATAPPRRLALDAGTEERVEVRLAATASSATPRSRQASAPGTSSGSGARTISKPSSGTLRR